MMPPWTEHADKDPKGELQARLEVLFRRYAAGLDPLARLPPPEEIVEHFRAEIRTPRR